jgi:hypothetical protein
VGSKKRARTARREADRTLRKDVKTRQRLVEAAPGGAADRPLTVRSTSVIEVEARSLPCVQCGGELDLRQHAASGPLLRVVKLVCRICHTPREVWFRVEPALAN